MRESWLGWLVLALLLVNLLLVLGVMGLPALGAVGAAVRIVLAAHQDALERIAAEHDFVPGWNFNKVLLGPEGEVLGTWGSMTNPKSSAIVGKITPLLSK